LICAPFLSPFFCPKISASFWNLSSPGLFEGYTFYYSFDTPYFLSFSPLPWVAQKVQAFFIFRPDLFLFPFTCFPGLLFLIETFWLTFFFLGFPLFPLLFKLVFSAHQKGEPPTGLQNLPSSLFSQIPQFSFILILCNGPFSCCPYTSL